MLFGGYTSKFVYFSKAPEYRIMQIFTHLKYIYIYIFGSPTAYHSHWKKKKKVNFQSGKFVRGKVIYVVYDF